MLKMTPSELDAVKRTALNAVSTLKVAGYAGTGEQLRGAIEVLVRELESREELPAPEEEPPQPTQRKKAAVR